MLSFKEGQKASIELYNENRSTGNLQDISRLIRKFFTSEIKSVESSVILEENAKRLLHESEELLDNSEKEKETVDSEEILKLYLKESFVKLNQLTDKYNFSLEIKEKAISMISKFE